MSLAFGRRGALGFEQVQVSLLKRFQVADVGTRPKPADDRVEPIPDRQCAREEPAVVAVAAKQPVLEPERSLPCICLQEHALGLGDRVRAMLLANLPLLDLRTGQGEYGEKPPSSYHIYFWTIGDSRSPLDVAAQFEQHETLDAMLARAVP